MRDFDRRFHFVTVLSTGASGPPSPDLTVLQEFVNITADGVLVYAILFGR